LNQNIKKDYATDAE